VSEGQTTRAASSRDLALLVFAAVIGAIEMSVLSPLLAGMRPPIDIDYWCETRYLGRMITISLF